MYLAQARRDLAARSYETNHLVWVAPNGTALVIDSHDGREKVDDQEIDKLFVAKK